MQFSHFCVSSPVDDISFIYFCCLVETCVMMLHGKFQPFNSFLNYFMSGTTRPKMTLSVIGVKALSFLTLLDSGKSQQTGRFCAKLDVSFRVRSGGTLKV